MTSEGHKVRIFLNPHASGSADIETWDRAIRRRLFRSTLEFKTPASYEDLQKELKVAVAEKVDVVVSVGGDGTVNSLIQHLGGTKTAFLIIPAGTANDLAHEMGIIGRVDEAVQKIRTGNPDEIDLIKINQRLMATNGGLGIVSAVAHSVNDIRHQFPAFKKLMHLMHHNIYSAMLGFHLLGKSLKYHECNIESDSFNGPVRSPLLMINNQPALGGNFRMAPMTKNDDGIFNVCIFNHPTRLEFIKALQSCRFRGGPDPNDQHLISFETRAVNIRCTEPSLFYGDGDLIDEAVEFNVSIVPKALRVYGYRAVRENVDQRTAL